MFKRYLNKSAQITQVESLEDRRLMSVTYGANLILNPGAEAYNGDADGFNIITPNHWTASNNPTVLRYGHGYAAAANVNKPNNGGSAFFGGGPDDTNTDFFQTIDLSSISNTIGAGQVSFALSAAIGGRSTDNDSATVSINFRDASQILISQVNTADVSRSDRKDRSKFIRRTRAGTVPTDARFAQIQIHFKREDGSYNDGYADNLSLILATNVPSTEGITPSLASTTVKPTQVTGSKIKGTVVLNLTNTSTSANKGVDTIALYASNSGAVDSNSILIGSVKRNLSLLAGRTTRLAFAIKSLILPTGTFSIFARTTDYLPTVVTASTGISLTVGAPFVSLSATVGPVSPASTTHDQPISFTLIVRNTGNIDLTGLATITVGLTSDGTTVAVPLTTLFKRFAVKANMPGVLLRIKVRLPSNPPGGVFEPIVTYAQGGSTITAVGTVPVTIVT